MWFFPELIDWLAAIIPHPQSHHFLCHGMLGMGFDEFFGYEKSIALI